MHDHTFICTHRFICVFTVEMYAVDNHHGSFATKE